MWLFLLTSFLLYGGCSDADTEKQGPEVKLGPTASIAEESSYDEGFRGVFWGASIDNITEEFTLNKKDGVDYASYIRANDGNIFFDKKTKGIEYIFRDGAFKAVGINIKKDQFDYFARKLASKYGEPITVKNDSRGRVYRWNIENVTILIENIPLLRLHRIRIEHYKKPKITAHASKSSVDSDSKLNDNAEQRVDNATRDLRNRLIKTIHQKLRDFEFKMMGRAKKQEVYIENGKLFFRTRFFDSTNPRPNEIPLEDYQYIVHLSAIDIDRSKLKWNSFWNYGDILIHTKEDKEEIEVTTFPSKYARDKSIRYKNQFEIFGINHKDAFHPLKRLIETY